MPVVGRSIPWLLRRIRASTAARWAAAVEPRDLRRWHMLHQHRQREGEAVWPATVQFSALWREFLEPSPVLLALLSAATTNDVPRTKVADPSCCIGLTFVQLDSNPGFQSTEFAMRVLDCAISKQDSRRALQPTRCPEALEGLRYRQILPPHKIRFHRCHAACSFSSPTARCCVLSSSDLQSWPKPAHTAPGRSDGFLVSGPGLSFPDASATLV